MPWFLIWLTNGAGHLKEFIIILPNGTKALMPPISALLFLPAKSAALPAFQALCRLPLLLRAADSREEVPAVAAVAAEAAAGKVLI